MIQPGAQQAAHVAIGQGGAAGQALGKGPGGVLQLGGGQQAVDEPQAQGLVGAEALAQHGDLQGATQAHQARQRPGRAHVAASVVFHSVWSLIGYWPE